MQIESLSVEIDFHQPGGLWRAPCPFPDLLWLCLLNGFKRAGLAWQSLRWGRTRRWIFHHYHLPEWTRDNLRTAKPKGNRYILRNQSQRHPQSVKSWELNGTKQHFCSDERLEVYQKATKRLCLGSKCPSTASSAFFSNISRYALATRKPSRNWHLKSYVWAQLHRRQDPREHSLHFWYESTSSITHATTRSRECSINLPVQWLP